MTDPDAVADVLAPGETALILWHRRLGPGHAIAAYHTTEGIRWVDPQAPADRRVSTAPPSPWDAVDAHAVVLGRDGHPRPGALERRSMSGTTLHALTDPMSDGRYGTKLKNIFGMGKKTQQEPLPTAPRSNNAPERPAPVSQNNGMHRRHLYSQAMLDQHGRPVGRTYFPETRDPNWIKGFPAWTSTPIYTRVTHSLPETTPVPWSGGNYFIAVHSHGAQARVEDTQGGEYRVYGADLGAIVRRRPSFQRLMAQNPDAGLVMIACNAGAYDDGLAQQVADHLERPVHAAAGKVYIEDYQSPPRPWISQTPSGATGEFITVQPRLGQETEVSFHEGGVEMPADQQRVIERFASRAADAARRAGTDPKQKPVITVVGYASGRRGDSDGLDTGQKRAEAVTAWLQQSLRHRLGEGRLDDVVTVTVSRGEDLPQSVLDTGRDRSSLLRRATITLHTPTLRDNDESDEDEDLEPLAFNAGPAGPSGSSRRRSVERSADRVPTTRTPAVPRPSAQSVTDQLGRMDLDRTSRSVGQGNEGAGTQTYPLVDSAVAERWRATFSSARRTLRDLADQQQLVERAAQIVAGHHVPPPGQHSPLPANARAYQDLYGNVVYAVAAQLHADRHHPQPYHRATSLAQQAAAEFRTAPPAHRSDPAPPDAGASRPSTSRHQARQRSSNDARYR